MQAELPLPPSPEFYNSLRALQACLAEHGLRMQKQWGQNFLVNPSVRQRLVEAAGITEADSVWEIGPGLGALTSLLAGRCRRLTLFEVDRGFAALLRQWFLPFPGVEIEEGDVLKRWQSVAREQGMPAVIMGNLPYNIASVILASFIEGGFLPQRWVVTVQKEVALRMCETVGGEHYSSFSMLCALDYRVTKITDIAPGSFYPKPDVVSSAVLMEKRQPRQRGGFSLDDGSLRWVYHRLIRDLFKQRRKTIENSLLKGGCLAHLHPNLTREWCAACGIRPSDRGERVSVEQAWALAALVANEGAFPPPPPSRL